MTTTEPRLRRPLRSGEARDPGGGDHPGGRRPRWLPDALGVAWVVVAGIAVLVPALLHGVHLGPFDQLAFHGLTAVPGVHPRYEINSDLVNSLMPWSTMAWQQVHAGHLPLWNPYGGLGVPLASNWQSAPFSLAAVVGYAAPMRLAFTVSAMVNLAVAGTGMYVLGRVLRVGVLGAATMGTLFELSGPFAGWLGYPFVSVLSFAGWILAFGLLAVRGGRHRSLATCGLAAGVAGSLLGGQPEGFTVLALAVAVFFAVVLAGRTRLFGGQGPVLGPCLRLAGGAAAGVGLALPFALPALQVTSHSIRSKATFSQAFPLHLLNYLVFQGFDGLPIAPAGHPIAGRTIFGLSIYYPETTAYVGAAALVLAAVALGLRRRDPALWGLATVAVASLLLVFSEPADRVVQAIPLVGQVQWARGLMPLALSVSALAGVGLDAVVRHRDRRSVVRWLGRGFGVATAVVALDWLLGRGGLTASQRAVRSHSFVWPTVEVVVGVVATGALWWRTRRPGAGRASKRAGVAAGVALLVVQTGYLLAAGAPMVQSSPTSWPQTPVLAAYSASVGSSVVGFGATLCDLGIQPNDNGVYGVHELEVYDPALPKEYFTAWAADTRTSPGDLGLNLFCPVVTSTAVAREFGVRYVLEPVGTPGPPGTRLVRTLGDETLWEVPGAGQATVAPLVAGGFPADAVTGTPVPVRHPSPSRWALTVSTPVPAALRLHLSDVPGWHATLDGRPLALRRYAGMMLEARVPPGRHRVVLWYWPSTLTLGLAGAACALVALATAVVLEVRRNRRDDGPSAPVAG